MPDTNENCTEIEQAERKKFKAKVESGTIENSRREVKGEAGSKPRHRHKVPHSLKGPEEGGSKRQGPEDKDASPQLEKGCREVSGRNRILTHLGSWANPNLSWVRSCWLSFIQVISRTTRKRWGYFLSPISNNCKYTSRNLNYFCLNYFCVCVSVVCFPFEMLLEVLAKLTFRKDQEKNLSTHWYGWEKKSGCSQHSGKEKQYSQHTCLAPFYAHKIEIATD